MAEIARGERIAQLREARGLTQDEFPFALRDFNDGNHVASRRAVQSWEAGGGIKPKNAKIVADFFRSEGAPRTSPRSRSETSTTEPTSRLAEPFNPGRPAAASSPRTPRSSPTSSASRSTRSPSAS